MSAMDSAFISICVRH